MNKFDNFVVNKPLTKQQLEASTDEQKSRFKKELQRTNFSITLNPNVSYRNLSDPNFRKRFFAQLQEVGDELEFVLQNPNFITSVNDQMKSKKVRIINYNWFPEQGRKIGAVHLQGAVSYDRKVMLDFKKLNLWVNEALYPFSTGARLFLHLYKDNQRLMEIYIQKEQQNRLDVDDLGEIPEEEEQPNNFDNFQITSEVRKLLQYDLTGLKRIAKAKGLKGYSRLKKAQLIELLKDII